MHIKNRRDGKREREWEIKWEKEINRSEYVCRIRDYISFIYCWIFVNNMISVRVFNLKLERQSWFKMQLHLGDCLPYLSFPLVGVWSNIFHAIYVISLWLLTKYFNPGKDAASCLFCSICSTKKHFFKIYQIFKLKCIKFLIILICGVMVLLIGYFLELYFEVFGFVLVMSDFFDPKADMHIASVNQKVIDMLFMVLS